MCCGSSATPGCTCNETHAYCYKLALLLSCSSALCPNRWSSSLLQTKFLHYKYRWSNSYSQSTLTLRTASFPITLPATTSSDNPSSILWWTCSAVPSHSRRRRSLGRVGKSEKNWSTKEWKWCEGRLSGNLCSSPIWEHLCHPSSRGRVRTRRKPFSTSQPLSTLWSRNSHVLSLLIILLSFWARFLWIYSPTCSSLSSRPDI